MSDHRTVHVSLGEQSYDVLIGHGARRQLERLVPASAKRAVVVTQDGLPSVDLSIEHTVVELGRGEEHKSLHTLERLCSSFAAFGLTRNDLVIAVGGGMVTDVAGFAAASYHRGTPVVHVATSLLGMVDAAIGGKTGVNLPEGKNLVGAFWQPVGVVCDLDFLSSLPERERRCGYGEMAKYHFMTGDDLLALNLVDRVARCVEIKAEIVAGDERESGRRALLNYGHTLAHALEIATDHELAHGEAVAIGLVYAALVAELLGRISAERVDEHRAVIDRYGLSSELPPEVAADDLIALMHRDKKAVDGLTFVLDSDAGLEVVTGVSDDIAATALAAMT